MRVLISTGGGHLGWIGPDLLEVSGSSAVKTQERQETDLPAATPSTPLHSVSDGSSGAADGRLSLTAHRQGVDLRGSNWAEVVVARFLLAVSDGRVQPVDVPGDLDAGVEIRRDVPMGDVLPIAPSAGSSGTTKPKPIQSDQNSYSDAGNRPLVRDEDGQHQESDRESVRHRSPGARGTD